MKIFYGKQHIFKNDYLVFKKILDSSFLTQGKAVKKFEKIISKYLNVKNVTVCNSGTSALLMALNAINVKRGDVIMMPAINFIAAYNMSKTLGARVFLVDVNSSTGQMCPDSLMKIIKIKKIKKIKAIITMYLGGFVENNIKLYKLKKIFNCYLIEDACHAFGSSYNFDNKKFKIGSCKHADLSTFSFHPLKTITTGEGGAVTTNNKNIAKNLNIFRSHGIIKNNRSYWNYNVNSIGYNFRLSDLNCALGISQLKNIKKILAKRNYIADIYRKKFSKLSKYITLPDYINKLNSSNHLFIVLIDFKKFQRNKNFFFHFMNKNNIFPQQHYIPIYKFNNNSFNSLLYPNSEIFFNKAISLPIHYDINYKDVNKIIKLIKKFIKLYKIK